MIMMMCNIKLIILFMTSGMKQMFDVELFPFSINKQKYNTKNFSIHIFIVDSLLPRQSVYSGYCYNHVIINRNFETL